MGNLKRTTLRINNIKKKRNLTKRKMNKNRTRRRYYNGGMPPLELEECPICKEYMKDNLITLTNCHHQFHSYCIKEWIGISKTCPICRTATHPNDTLLTEKTPDINLMFVNKTYYYDDKTKEKNTFIIDGIMDNDYFGENKDFKQYIEDKLIYYLSKNDAIKHIEFKNLFKNLRMEEIKKLQFEEKRNADDSSRATDDFIMKFAVFIASRPDLKSLTFIDCNLKGTDFQILVDALLFNKDNKLEKLIIIENDMLGIENDMLGIENDMLGIKSIPNELMVIYGRLVYHGKVVNEYVVDETVVNNLVRLINHKKHNIPLILLGKTQIQKPDKTLSTEVTDDDLVKTLRYSISQQPVDGVVYVSLQEYVQFKVLQKEAAQKAAQKAALEAAQEAAQKAAAAEAAQKAAAAEAAEAQKTFIKKMAEYSVAKLSSGVSKLRRGVSNLPNSVKSRLPNLPNSVKSHLDKFFDSKQTGGKNRKKRYSRKVK